MNSVSLPFLGLVSPSRPPDVKAYHRVDCVTANSTNFEHDHTLQKNAVSFFTKLPFLHFCAKFVHCAE